MNQAMAEIRTVVVEREFPHAPDKLWRALTQPHLIVEWFMKNDFKAELGHQFKLIGDWGAVDCEILTIEPHKTLPIAQFLAKVKRIPAAPEKWQDMWFPEIHNLKGS